MTSDAQKSKSGDFTYQAHWFEHIDRKGIKREWKMVVWYKGKRVDFDA